MSERWKKIKRVLWWKSEDISPSLRKKMLAADLAMSGLLLWMIWMQLGCPLPTQEMEFRRMERTHLLPRSEIVFSNEAKGEDGLRVSRRDRSVFALDGTELHLRGRWMVGIQGDWVTAACLDESGRRIHSFPLVDGLALVPLTDQYGYLAHNGYWVAHGPGETPEGDPAYVYQYHNFSPFLLVNVPEETANIELIVWLEQEERTNVEWRLENGVWMLGIETEVRLHWERLTGISYTLRLFQADGTVLLEQNGTLAS